MADVFDNWSGKPQFAGHETFPLRILWLRKAYDAVRGGTPSRKIAVEKSVAEGQKKPDFLGEKGLGRLSAMRLGGTLSIETARKKDTKLNRLSIDWRAFEDVNKMIEDIDIKASTSGAKPFRSPSSSARPSRIIRLSSIGTEFISSTNHQKTASRPRRSKATLCRYSRTYLRILSTG